MSVTVLDFDLSLITLTTGILVFQNSYNKLPLPHWLKTTHICSLTVVEARVLKPRYHEGHSPSECSNTWPAVLISGCCIWRWPGQTRAEGLIRVCVCAQLCPTPGTVACQAPLSMEFCRQKYWSALRFPSPGDLPHPGIQPLSLGSPALVGRFFTTTPPGKHLRGRTESRQCGTLIGSGKVMMVQG